MEIQGVPKIGISSVVHSKHIDPDCIDVVDNDIALFDTESVVSLYSGPSKLEVVTVGLCLSCRLHDFRPACTFTKRIGT